MKVSASNAGFTLIELLAALAIVIILASISAPSLSRSLQNVTLERYSRELLSGLNLARSEAILRNTSVTICPSTMWSSQSAVCAGGYGDGWIVYADPNPDDVVDGDSKEVLRIGKALPAGYRLLNSAGTAHVGGVISYRADGTARRTLTMQICPPSEDVGSLSIVLNVVGRARIQRNWGSCGDEV